jgi:uncharacterized DUF497 family protein
MRFSWDLSKDLLNQRDHGITFQEATTVFGDSLAEPQVMNAKTMKRRTREPGMRAEYDFSGGVRAP